jgi:energy-coupling factor transport system substrate-specific component
VGLARLYRHIGEIETPREESSVTIRPNVTRDTTLMGIAALCVALNVGLGTAVNLIKLPIYLDAIGTIAIGLLAGSLGFRGFFMAATVGAVSFGLSAILFNPVLFWFIPTQIAIAAFSFYVVRPILSGYIKDGDLSIGRGALILVVGILLGAVAGVVSAPIIAYVFGGVTGAGSSLVVALLIKSGDTLFNSVLLSGLASEPIDKTLQLVVALALVRVTPRRIRASLV